jgi:hypothetical protein
MTPQVVPRMSRPSCILALLMSSMIVERCMQMIQP